MRGGSRSTAAIIAAVLAACGSAVGVVPVDDDEVAPGGSGPSDASANDGARSPADVIVEATTDNRASAIDASPWNGGPCPPMDDPYWDAVLERSPDGHTTWGDASVCGAIEAGSENHPALANGDLACVLAATNQYGGDAGCPIAVCTTTRSMIGVPCDTSTRDDGDGGRLPILSDAGKCLVESDAAVAIFCGYSQAGRRPRGYVPPRTRAALAEQAVLEAASITAFEELAEELREFGAPQDLVDACFIAAREEAEHARIMTALANRFGAEVPDAKPSHSPRRTLLACAIDNVVEGLVRETMAAAIALHQARIAGRDLRADLAVIARDEISHADLSRRIHAWVMSALDDDQETRAALANAMGSAIDQLAGEVAGHDASRVIFDGLRASIWREELAALA